MREKEKTTSERRDFRIGKKLVDALARLYSSLRRMLHGNEVIAMISVAVSLVVLAFVWPWLSLVEASDNLERYLPTRDGASEFSVSYGREGEVLYFESRNLEYIPDLRAMNDLSLSQSRAIQTPYLESGEEVIPTEDLQERLSDVEAYRQNVRRAYPDGETRTLQNILVRDEDGEFIVGTYDPDRDRAADFTPRLMLVPADLGPETEEWSSSGTFGNARYESSGRVIGTETYEGESQTSRDCLRVETVLSLRPDDGAAEDSTFRDLYCPDVGLVESEESSDDVPSRREAVYSSDGSLSADAEVPEVRNLRKTGTAPESPDDSWTLRRFASTLSTGDAPAEGTFSPVIVPGREPQVLAASVGGDLLSFRADGSGETALWSFHTGGSIYGRPAFDPESGRIYFGSTDRRVYALDGRGLYLWDFKASDSVASSPLVAGDVVIFGSEDGNVYGLDSRTGELRWSYETGGPVASSAALADGVAVIGSDDGAVYGLDPEDGSLVWMQNTGGAVEAAVTASEGRVYVPSRDGGLYAFDGETGDQLWETTGSVALESAPVVGGEKVYAVNGAGELVAYDLASGRRLWSTGTNSYIGSPAVVGHDVVVAGRDGDVYAYDAAGRRTGSWSRPKSQDGPAATHAFRFGPSVGDGAVWITDLSGQVSRFSPSGPESDEP